MMVTIAWNPLGFSLIVALLKGRTFNAEYYRDNIPAALTQLQPEDDAETRCSFWQCKGSRCSKMSNFLRRKWTAARSPSILLTWSCTIRLLSVRLCQGTSQRNGVSIVRGITRRNWWSGWLPCLSTGWRDWNGCLRTMVIIIYKLPVGSFTFLQCLSGTELLILSGTPYIWVTGDPKQIARVITESKKFEWKPPDQFCYRSLLLDQARSTWTHPLLDLIPQSISPPTRIVFPSRWLSCLI
jgi:hypothetical protein